MIKLMVTGSRTIIDINYIEKCCKEVLDKIYFAKDIKNPKILFLHGNALGVDQITAKYFKKIGIEVKKFDPNWRKYGKGAGKIRNIEMVKECDYGFAIWDGKSRGTKHAIEELKKVDKLFRIFYYII